MLKLHYVIYLGTINNIINRLNLIPIILCNRFKKCRVNGKKKLLYFYGIF